MGLQTALLVSNICLWCLFLVQSAIIFLLLRQVGLLYLRIQPAGARTISIGPEIGDELPAMVLEDMDDPTWKLEITNNMQEDVLLIFMSASCRACRSLVPAIGPLLAETRGVIDWALVIADDPGTSRGFRRENGLTFILFSHAPSLRTKLNVGMTPYAILIQRSGKVVAKGIVNQIEHLESIVDVIRTSRGPASVAATWGVVGKTN
jgi:methylamine dehydrogenase accessory protein MauD